MNESKTGTYKMVDGKLTKISDKIPNMNFVGLSCPKGGFHSENLGGFVKSRKHKLALMNQRGVREAG